LAAVCLALTVSTVARAQEKAVPAAPAPVAAAAVATPAPAAAAAAPAPAAAVPAPAMAAPAAPVPAAIPFAPGPDFQVDRPGADDAKAEPEMGAGSLVGALFKMVLVLALVLALVWVTLNWGLRKLMRLSPVRQAVVKVHERIPLDAKKIVYLVEAGDEYLLLGAGEREVTLLTRLDAERTRALLAKKAERTALAPVKGKPFWERLLVKPPPKPGPEGSSGGAGGSQTTS
jgi:flagellar protein FliO/FliZ